MSDNISDTLTEIAEKLDTLITIMTSTVTPPKKPVITLFAWLEEWFNTYKAPNLRDKGYDLKHTIEKHITPNIQDKPLNEYTSFDLTKALNAVKSERMRQVSRQVYNQAFREAQRLGHIDKNPVEWVKSVAHTYKVGRSLTHAEEREFLEKAKATPFYALFGFYLLTGARPSEPLGLTWSDIGENTLHIRGTKTHLSNRVIPLSESVKNLLNSVPKTCERVFPYTYSNVLKHFKRLRSSLSFYMTLKDLRHTFGTRCLESGVSMKTVQKWLGHSTYNTTANIYSHVTTEFEREERARFDNLTEIKPLPPQGS